MIVYLIGSQYAIARVAQNEDILGKGYVCDICSHLVYSYS